MGIYHSPSNKTDAYTEHSLFQDYIYIYINRDSCLISSRRAVKTISVHTKNYLIRLYIGIYPV